jgi:hypothetical protein
MMDNMKSLNYVKIREDFQSTTRDEKIYGLVAVAPIVLSSAAYLAAWNFYPVLGNMQLIWSSILLTYMGGMRLGFMLTESNNTLRETATYSSVPAAVAWSSMLLPFELIYLGQMSGLFLSWYFDHQNLVYSDHHLALLSFYTLAAIGALGIGLAFSLMYRKPKQTSQ